MSTNDRIDGVINSYPAEDVSLSNLSRYKRLMRITDNQGDTYIETPDKINIPTNPDDQYFEVTNTELNRLDVVSNYYYKTPLLWWVIADASNIDDPLVVPIGTLLRIPAYNTLYGTGGILL